MAVVRTNDFQIVDLGATLEIVPRQYRLITNMDLFTAYHGVTTIAQIERVDEVVTDFPARRRQGERNYVGTEKAQLRNFNIPFFPLDRQITAADVQNFRKYFTADAPKTVEDVVARVVRRIRISHEQLKEKAMLQAIMGKSWAPQDPTAQYNYFTEWGVTQHTANIDFTDVATDPTDIIEADARAYIIDNAGDNGNNYNIVVLASRKWFSALIAHPLVMNAYQYYSSTQEPLRRRLGQGQENANNRMFVHKNVTYIEDISNYIPDGEAYILPQGIDDMFQIHYAPADDVRDANTPAQELYLWYKSSAYLREEKVESETSFLTVNTRPELVVRSTGTFA
ncbi:major capsid protein [Escherichia phage 4MG]|uniref:Putative major capsid protein n=1 Tax=Escherichia phage 4MG TaxID=1391428 RepID=V5KSU8_9CAUD|nr:major capsid protein [Escherichia phage 4MG]AGZ17543.1 putative major capsid protein [Escherichia phage 4MG]